MTFRSGPVKDSTVAERLLLSMSDLKVGQKVNGAVKRVTDFGIFVSIENTKLSGLCHKSEVRV